MPQNRYVICPSYKYPDKPYGIRDKLKRCEVAWMETWDEAEEEREKLETVYEQRLKELDLNQDEHI